MKPSVFAARSKLGGVSCGVWLHWRSRRGAAGALVLIAVLLGVFPPSGSGPAIEAVAQPPVASDMPVAPAPTPLRTKTTQPAASFPTADETRRNWPRFRGPGGLGVCADAHAPTTWDAGSGAGIQWKTRVPLSGNNSPVVWNDCVFLSGADANHSAVYCFDAERGALKWQQYVTHNSACQGKMPDVNADTGYAAPTMTTDGQRVFAMFANGDVAAFDREGKAIWTRRLGVPDNPYGHAASLAMYRDLLLIQFDQGSGKDQRSRLLALNHITGQTTWVAQRAVPSSWSSPIVISIGQHPLIITAANPWLIAYNPTNGKEYWRVKCLRADVGPSPVFANGIIYTASESSLLTAIRVDMADPHAQPSVLWTAEDGLPDTASPLATDEFVFVLASYGVLTCYDARSGELLWDEEFDSDFSSSPSLVGTRLYLFSIFLARTASAGSCSQIVRAVDAWLSQTWGEHA